jgi:hypothetical protein
MSPWTVLAQKKEKPRIRATKFSYLEEEEEVVVIRPT